jgi:transcriptional regulator with XRE-family HTH domain
MKFANQLKTARLEAGLSQKELAQKTSITPSLISRYELGKVIPRLETVNKIMKILNFKQTEIISHINSNNITFINIPPLSIETNISDTTQLCILKTDLKVNNLQVDNLVCTTMNGNSMQNLLNDGDKLIIDISQKKLIDGKIYAFNQGKLLRIKILQNLPNHRVRMKSYNSYEYPDEIATLNEIELIGQVVYKAGFL